MCLIIHKPATTDFGRKWLANFYNHNRDGAGIMMFNGEAVDVEKITAPSFRAFQRFYEQFASGRECVIHLRMRTHGRIDDENTHPYYVKNGIFMMHNGVLAHGNAADRSKSDTWHYIRNRIIPDLRLDQHALAKKEYRASLARDIGRNNRFVFLGPDGKVRFVNRDSGITWRGAWFSNTYAWTVPTFRTVQPASKPLPLIHRSKAADRVNAEQSSSFSDPYATTKWSY